MITISWPWIFLLLPLPWLVRYVLPAAKTSASDGLKVPFFQRLAEIEQEQKLQVAIALFNWRQYMAFLIWALLIFALSGPKWLGDVMPMTHSGRALMLAVDLSGSMQIKDMRWQGQTVNRLQAVKAIAGDFIEEREGDRLGLVLFGTRAYLQTPLTYDRETVKAMLNDASIGLAGDQTAIGDGLGLAIKQLLTVPQKSRAIILLTDGVNNAGSVTPLSAARIAEKEHIKLYTIGMGSDEVQIQTPFGRQTIKADLDIKTLQEMSNMTGGEFFRAENAQELVKIYQEINQLEPISQQQQELRSITLLYPWPLGLALLLSLLLSWRYWKFNVQRETLS